MPDAGSRSTVLAAFGPRVRIRRPELVREGSAETLVLRRIEGVDPDTVAAARALVRRHLPIAAAYREATRLFDAGEAVVEVPKVEDVDRLASELSAAGIEVAVRLQHGDAPTGATG